MAREEKPKEDLILEATAMVERAEFLVDDQRITVGFRDNGAASVFFGDEPVYHFNAAKELRRAYNDGLLKADEGRLVRMRRERTDKEVQLISTTISDKEQAEFLTNFQSRCDTLLTAMEDGLCIVNRQVPEENVADLWGRVRSWLTQLEHPITIAAKPQLGR